MLVVVVAVVIVVLVAVMMALLVKVFLRLRLVRAVNISIRNYRLIDMVFMGNCGLVELLKNLLHVSRQKAARKSTL